MRLGSLPQEVLTEARKVLRGQQNILVSGGTGSGKTTLLNALIELLPDDERVVAIEDTLELRIDRSNCVRFEARGIDSGSVTIRDLVRHALRHRPDHIVVGEVRGGEAADLLQALNTGHGGSLTTVHANNAESALSRLASCAMQGGGGPAVGSHLPECGGRHCDGDSHDASRGKADSWKRHCASRVTTHRRTAGSPSRSEGNTMTDEEKIIRVTTLKDFDQKLGRDGEEESMEGTMSLDGEATDAPFTVKDAARFLGVSPSLVYAYVERKQIPHLRVMGRNIRFLKSDLEPFRASFRQEVENGKTE